MMKSEISEPFPSMDSTEMEISVAIIEECVALRHLIHQSPELSGQEFQTRDLIVRELRSAGLEVVTFPDSTGVVGLWPGRDRSRSIALRADMDALPMQETSAVPWASHSGHAMHACGHDGHSSILLGVAKHLGLTKKHYAVDIKLLFQPAEESGNGARQMVIDGVLDNPSVMAVFGMHGWPDLPLGKIGVHGGAVMASVDNFEITVLGRGGHGAQPHHALDPIFGAAQLIVAAQSLVSRSTDPIEASVLTFGHIQGGRTYNVIPEDCLLRGTLRTHSEELRIKLKTGLESLTQSLCQGLGLDAHLTWVEGCPATVNDSAMAALAKRAIVGSLGEAHCVEPKPSMAGEDFPFFMEKIPGAYLWLGLGQDQGALHNPRFDFNDKALAIGMRVFLSILDEKLGKPT
jgi:hippurate hydrolase